MRGPPRDDRCAYRDPLGLPVPDASVRVTRTVRARGRIVRQHALTRDMLEVVVQRDPESRPLHGQAGQFAVLGVADVAGPRPFSFARAPESEAPGEHSFLIRLVPGGAFSEWLRAADRTGTALDIVGPLGRFTLEESTAPMLCVAGGSGLSAIRALVEHAANRALARDCWLYYGARTERDLCLGAAFAALAARWHPAHRLRFVQVLSEEPADSEWSGARGLVADFAVGDSIARGRLDPAAAQAYLCGPPPMIAAAEHLLDLAGMPAAAIHRDVFEDTRSPAPAIDNLKCVLCDECLLVKPLADCIVEASALERDAGAGAPGFTRVLPARSPGLYYGSLVIDEGVCIRCGACVQACPHGAISTTHGRRTVTLRRQP